MWEDGRFMFASHDLANPAAPESRNKNVTTTNVTVHKPSQPPLQLRYVGRYHRRALSCENSPDVESIAKKHFSTMEDTAIIPHSRSPFDRNFPSQHRAPFGWISDFPFYAAGKRSFALVLPSMKRLFPLLWVDFVEKYRWRGYRSFVSVSFLSRKVKTSRVRRVPFEFCKGECASRGSAYRANAEWPCAARQIIRYSRKSEYVCRQRETANRT